MVVAKKISLRMGKFKVQTWTQGDGPPLLYLHGWDGLSGWPTWLDELAKSFRVVVAQHPGYGSSTGIGDLADFLDLSLYYLDFIEAVGMDRPIVVGHSLGGNIAAEMAAVSPPSVGKLVLVAPTGLWDPGNPVADIFAMTPSERRKATWYDDEDAERKGYFKVPKTDRQKGLAGIEVARSLSTAAKFLFPIPDKGLKKRIHRVKSPTLLLWGADDEIVPATYGKLFRKMIPNSKLVKIRKAGHHPLIEQSVKSIDAILGFLG